MQDSVYKGKQTQVWDFEHSCSLSVFFYKTIRIIEEPALGKRISFGNSENNLFANGDTVAYT